MSNLRLTEKYRPKTWDDVVGQPDIIKKIKSSVERAKLKGDEGVTPHFLLVGPPGSGKTTVANIIAESLGYNIHSFNASDNRTLTFVREEIKKISQYAGARVVILDEADEMIKEAQMALKRMMETTSAVFILLANREWKIDDAIKSRCAKFTFGKLSDEVIDDRIAKIIEAEHIKIQPTQEVMNGLSKLVHEANGDMRQAINDLETIIDESGYITNDTVATLHSTSGLTLISLNYALSGNFETAKEVIEKSYVEGKYDPRRTIQEIYDGIPNLQIDVEIKIRLFEKLGETDANLKFGGDPIIQIIAFMAFVWLVPHLSKCPVLGGV